MSSFKYIPGSFVLTLEDKLKYPLRIYEIFPRTGLELSDNEVASELKKLDGYDTGSSNPKQLADCLAHFFQRFKQQLSETCSESLKAFMAMSEFQKELVEDYRAKYHK